MMIQKVYYLLLAMILSGFCHFTLKAQPKDIHGPSEFGGFGAKVTVLTNGNYVVTDPNYYAPNGPYNAGAVYLYNGKTHQLISTVTGHENEYIGNEIYPLPNGNFVIKSSGWFDSNMQRVGAVTWASGTTGISGTISEANSIVGTGRDQLQESGGITVLPNSNFIISWPGWANGNVQRAGAATWVNGDTGITGTVSPQNSLVGTSTDAAISQRGVIILSNGNYVVGSPAWATWGNGNTGVTGTVSTSNSLSSGGYVTALKNGNYVVASPEWSNAGSALAGAVTWADGNTGLTGMVSPSNSLIGTTTFDRVGSGGVIALTNGHYVVNSPFWSNGAVSRAGAATWVNGAGPVTGIVSQANSLYGTHQDDQVGAGAGAALTNGNYVICSPYWERNGNADAGAATWGNGFAGTTGVVSESNSLVGTLATDRVGYGAVALTNGHYVVGSSACTIDGKVGAGAATWGNGVTGTTGVVSGANSLVGQSEGDHVGTIDGYGQIVPLTNGNYVVNSQQWYGQAGAYTAITWGNGATGSVGVVNSTNSLVKLSTLHSDYINIGVTPLVNGNYVVTTHWWVDNDPVRPHLGAVIWGNGQGGTIGNISSSNALLIPKNTGDYSDVIKITPLPDGNYVATIPMYGNPPGGFGTGSAATWGNGFTGTVGEANPCNSIVAPFPAYRDNTVYNPVYDYLIFTRSAENMITIFSATSKSLGTNAVSGQTNVQGPARTPLATADNCQIIAAVQPSGASPVNGPVDARVWVENSVPTVGAIPYLTRHYEITPTSNAATATGTLTLFFSQAEFNLFNSSPASNPKLPTGPDDTEGIAAIRIGKYPGTSGNGTGLPGSYKQGVALIDPDDENIRWSTDFQRWEVTFDVTGFSGFILQTYDGPLPVKLVSFTGERLEKDVILQWDIADAEHFSHFEIERSADAKRFEHAGDMAFDAAKSRYRFLDSNPFKPSQTLYYRLKMVDLDNTFAYSKILNVSSNDLNRARHYVSPNPITDHIDIHLRDYADQTATARITDLSGRTILSRQVQISSGKISLDITDRQILPGVYVISIESEKETLQFRIVRE
ncbi:MAG: T9SS type A sorting domain-containing protein [Dyadobacter sp.]|uniref:T9SS type A sorting domain-containing protein n=1 Tax=Dyadobacter sp. TaxID=1914288 RepID=UPI001B1AC724|nr:T9SS type A sorting domain-containing protein [Dyadobacter sp.]MBO9611406.1 T9SS type A sorting domain-containing protein [Dyadobacter sp.]